MSTCEEMADIFDLDVATDQLVTFLRPRNVVLMAGSGASIDAGLTSWEALALELKESLRRRGEPTDYKTVFSLADAANQALGDHDFQALLRRHFRTPHATPGELDLLLGSLRPYFRFVVTLNYDKLLESAFRVVRLGIDPPVTVSVETARHWVQEQEFFVLKYHGDIDQPETIALGQESYASRDYDELISILSGHRVLFVGYGFADPIFDHFLLNAHIKGKLSASSCYVITREEEIASLVKSRGYNVIRVPDFSRQKTLLQATQKALVADPMDQVRKTVFKLAPKVHSDRLWNQIHESVVATLGSYLVLEEAWEKGWDAAALPYVDDGELPLLPDLRSIVERDKRKVDKPWWGKFAMYGFRRPTSEQNGFIRVRRTSFEEYMTLWKALDEIVAPGGIRVRDQYLGRDICRRFEEATLPHILSAHVALLSADNRVLIARRSRDVHFETRAWSASMEETASSGRGRATDEEVEEFQRQYGEAKPVDRSLADTIRRGLKEELGILAHSVSSIRCFALATDWTYSDLAPITVVRSSSPFNDLEKFGTAADLGEFEIEPKERMQYHWMSADPATILRAIFLDEYEPRAGWAGRWHVSSKLRLFALLCSMVLEGETSWTEVAGTMNAMGKR